MSNETNTDERSLAENIDIVRFIAYWLNFRDKSLGKLTDIREVDGQFMSVIIRTGKLA